MDNSVLSNNFAENLRKFLVIFLKKFQWKCDSYSEEFLVTHSEKWVRGISCNPFRGNSHNSIQGISCNQFQGISCYQFCRKTGENVDKICGNSWEFPVISSSEPITGNFMGTIKFPRFSQEFLRNICIFPSKFTSQDLVVNNLTTIFAPPTF